MSLWRQITRGLRVLAHREKADQEIDEEVKDYLEQAAAELEASGLSPENALRTARLELGSPTSIREQVRSNGWENLLGTLVADLHFAARQLHHSPGFALVSLTTLALGIGASTAIFSAVNPILFQPLPYPHAERVMMIQEVRQSGAPRPVNFASFYGLSASRQVLDATAVMKPWQPTLSGADEPERLDGQRVSADYFRVLGVLPLLGRNFEQADDQFRGPNLVILSDRLWRRRFGGNTSITGRQIKLDETLYTVIGVMPGSFENVPSPTAELWAPLQYNSSLPIDGREWGHHLHMIGRLRGGVSATQASSELSRMMAPFAKTYAKGYDCCGGGPDAMIVTRLQDEITRNVKPALLAILGAVGLVLLVVCVNVTNLLLARSGRRRTEFGMRTALGAGRIRLARQLLAESLLIAGIGGALGMFVAKVGVGAIVALSPPGLPRVDAIRIDSEAFLFAFGITTFVGIVVGLVPAWQASMSDPRCSLQQRPRTTADSHQFTQGTLVISEVALALVLLAGAGLMLRSMKHLLSVDPGFESAHLLTMQVQETGRRFADDSVRARFFTQALEAVRQVPGVTGAAFTSQLPLSGDLDIYGMEFESRPGDNSESLLRYAVTPAYFETMGIPLIAGRSLDERDRAGAPGAIVISASLAKRKFPGQNPIGQRVRVGLDAGHPDRPWSTIVGVVGDVKQTSLALGAPDAYYTSTTQWAWVDTAQSLVVRTRGDAAAMAPPIKQAVWSVDKGEPIVRVATMDNLVSTSEAERHFTLIIFEAFGIVALILAAIGIYGVLSYGVTERTREIGIRAALGATRLDIVSLILRQGMILTAIGVVIGLGGAVAASRAFVAMLYGISRFDPITYLGVIALIVSTAGIACGVPAWRAAQVEPSNTLRAE